jgi:hypothetical protein
MTIYSNPVTGPVVGQPISGDFGKQNSGAPPANTVVAIPPSMSLLEACARGVVPRNSMVTAIAGVSTGAQNPTPIDDLCANGAGNQVNAGVAIPSAFGNPVIDIAGAVAPPLKTVAGTFTANAAQTNGPTPIDSETLTSCPVSLATTGANITLNGAYQG